jgi:hypothetical protein
MSTHRILLGLPRLLTAVVLALSGAYLLIYLYRWEWNRAIISGLFFVTAEVAMATAMIMRRLRALEDGLEHASRRPEADAQVLARIRQADVARPHPFRWLAPDPGRTSVFVPVLLGAGVILSALAYVVERIAEATALPALDRRLARRLAVLAPPPAAVRSPVATAATLHRRPRPARPAMATAWALVAAASFGVLAWLGVSTMLDATQTRPDPAERPVRTTITLEIVERHPIDGDLESAAALWVACRSSLGRGLPTEGEVVERGDTVALVLEPGIGRLASRRLTGCLSDLKLNLVRARVLDVDHEHAPAT